MLPPSHRPVVASRDHWAFVLIGAAVALPSMLLAVACFQQRGPWAGTEAALLVTLLGSGLFLVAASLFSSTRITRGVVWAWLGLWLCVALGCSPLFAGVVLGAMALVCCWPPPQPTPIVASRASAAFVPPSPASPSTSSNEVLLLRHSGDPEPTVINAHIRVRLGANQREHDYHVAFCPPLAQLPEVVCQNAADFPGEIRVAAIYPFGMRIHVRRPDARDPLSIVLQFRATADKKADNKGVRSLFSSSVT